MDYVNLIGSTLDSKYKIERELGRGGMGTVYLATHIGTSRLVAIKVIMPEFMKRTEFVERFKREAKAAGQLRHPNVVDVTDFGVAKTDIGEVAYLVMEYLDGFTLAQVLKKESNLSLLRTVDILEQVCSAVSEAHQHGIIHRDLKPDNIWLEPNQLGGFTVKVLDFGLVKLNEANTSTLPNDSQESRKGNENQTLEIASKTQIQITDTPDGEIVNSTPKEILEKEVLETKLIPNQVDTDDSENESRTTPDLTKVGTVLGTPLYMSPEQCSGERLTPQSDIYSLGIIAYEMLSGKPPFNGNYIEVMKSHQKVKPPILESKNAPKKVRNLIHSVLVKNPDERPPTAKAFAAQLRAEATGFGVLLQRSFEISIRHLPTLLPSATLFSLIITFLPVFFSLPTFFFDLEPSTFQWFTLINIITVVFIVSLLAFFYRAAITWWVVQILSYPLKPVSFSSALKVTKKKWKPLLKASLLIYVPILLAGPAFFILAFFVSAFWLLLSPVVMMENVEGLKALKRSKNLLFRSIPTVLALSLVLFLPDLSSLALVIGYGAITTTSWDQFLEALNTPTFQLIGPIILFPLSLITVLIQPIGTALLYLNTRQAGGETMNELLEEFEGN